jgi:hypothetical protein
MLIKRFLALGSAAALIGLLAGCGDVTQHEPGVYKGKPDPIASEEAAQSRSGPLRERGDLAFTDR